MAGSLDFKNMRALGTAGASGVLTHLADITFEEEVTSLLIHLMWANEGINGVFHIVAKSDTGELVADADIRASKFDFESEDKYLAWDLGVPFLTAEVYYTHNIPSEDGVMLFSGSVSGKDYVSKETIKSIEDKLREIKEALESTLKMF